jgi:hypothetical protein
MAVLSSSARDNLPDSAFAYVEPGGSTFNGKTTPGSKRHYPIHDANHVRNALARIAQGGRFGSEAKAKVMAAAKRFGIEHDESASTGRSLDSLYPEVRFLSDVPEIRSIADGQPAHITGYAAAFSKLSRRLGGFVERVMPGAFDASLRSVAAGDANVNLVCRFNHKDDMLLGTTQAGTLQLSIDERGLKYDVLPPSCRGDVLELVQRGDVRYSSFAFRCVNPGEDDTWGVTDYGFPMRSLHNTELIDVAPVTDPAYRDTTAVARNMTGAVESLAMWVDAEPAEVRSLLEAGQASRFFKRTDRPSAPRPAIAPPAAGESVMLDDQAVALRRWSYAPEPEERAADEGEPVSREQHIEETRAMHNAETMCRKYTDGEPCVMGAGHDGDCNGRCYARPHGLPCAMANGHHGAHTPMEVDDGAGRGPGRPRNRDGEQTEDAQAAETREQQEKRTLSGPEALMALEDMRRSLTSID